MKKNRTKGEISLHIADQLPKERPAEPILVFLVLGIILLTVHLISGKQFFVPKNILPVNSVNQDVYIWKAETADQKKGLYVYTQQQLAEISPDIRPLISEAPNKKQAIPMVTAVQYTSEKPIAVDLPPEVANIFFKPIPINRADKNILSSLPGVGPVLAERILQRREEYGPYKSKDELLQVSGIGPKKLARLADHITLN